MIPKIIHYVWVGENKIPRKIKKCMKTWRKHLGDYEFMFWNEKTFDINSHPFAKQAYEAKKWAFVSDYIRAFVVNKYGGIYLDTDVVVLDNFDNFLKNKVFVGFENPDYPFTAVFGSVSNHPFLKKVLSYYDNNDFKFDSENQYESVNTKIISEILIDDFKCVPNNKEQLLSSDIKVYPDYVLCNPSKESVAIHIFTGTWIEGSSPLKQKIVLFLKSNIRVKKHAALYERLINKNVEN